MTYGISTKSGESSYIVTQTNLHNQLDLMLNLVWFDVVNLGISRSLLKNQIDAIYRSQSVEKYKCKQQIIYYVILKSESQGWKDSPHSPETLLALGPPPSSEEEIFRIILRVEAFPVPAREPRAGGPSSRSPFPFCLFFFLFRSFFLSFYVYSFFLFQWAVISFSV